MVTSINAIETRYAGCRFRSRLEARWAVFFDAERIPWEYEPQGFAIGERHYLPDFYLPLSGTWIEVKGSDERLDIQLMLAASRYLPRPARRDAGPKLMILGSHPEFREEGDWGWVGIDAADADSDTEMVSKGLLAEQSGCDGCGATGYKGHVCFCTHQIARWGFGTYHKNLRPWWLDGGGASHAKADWLIPRLVRGETGTRSYNKARSARFEHGECG